MKKIDKKELTIGAAIPSCADLVGRDILIIGYAGQSGAGRIARKRKNEILARFAPIIYNRAIEEGSILDKQELFSLAAEHGAMCAVACGVGGVEGALFDIANAFSVGLEVYTKDIPIRQDTVEICNLLDINPYKLYSDGAYILFTDKGRNLCNILADKGIDSKVAGRVTKGLDKVFINNDERSFITPSRGKDELDKIISKGE